MWFWHSAVWVPQFCHMGNQFHKVQQKETDLMWKADQSGFSSRFFHWPNYSLHVHRWDVILWRCGFIPKLTYQLIPNQNPNRVLINWLSNVWSSERPIIDKMFCKKVKIQSSGRSCRELSQSGMKSSLCQSCNNQDSNIFVWDKQLEWGNKIESPGPNPLIRGRLIYLCLPIHSDMGRTPITHQVL